MFIVEGSGICGMVSSVVVVGTSIQHHLYGEMQVDDTVALGHDSC